MKVTIYIDACDFELFKQGEQVRKRFFDDARTVKITAGLDDIVMDDTYLRRKYKAKGSSMLC